MATRYTVIMSMCIACYFPAFSSDEYRTIAQKPRTQQKADEATPLLQPVYDCPDWEIDIPQRGPTRPSISKSERGPCCWIEVACCSALCALCIGCHRLCCCGKRGCCEE